MVQIGKERILAIIIILIAGMLSMNGIVDREIAMYIAMVSFTLAQGWHCYKLWNAHQEWKRETVMSLLAIVILFFVLR